MGKDVMQVKIHTDGGARGNPGPAGAGFVIVDAQTGATLHEAGIYLGETTNNVAEYSAMLHSLKVADELGAKCVELLSDSQLMVRQMTGQYRVKNAGLKPLHAEAKELAARFDKFKITHVRREQNKLADKLVNKAIDAR